MLTPEELKRDLETLAGPVFAKVGVDLIELNVRRKGGEVVVQILADLPNGGINLEQCSLLNRTMVDLIDQNMIIDQEYSLEVSSPGLDRPLLTRKDYVRMLHQEIRCVLKQPVAGKRDQTGILKEVKETAVCVDTQRYGQVLIPLEHIQKSVVVF